MRRLLIFLISIFLFLMVLGYFLPNQKFFSTTVNVSTPFDGVSRVIVNKDQWANWWPGKVINDSTLLFEGVTIHMKLLLLNGFNAKANEGYLSVDLNVQSIATYNAETAITLYTVLHFSSNPFIKLFQFIKSGTYLKKYESLLKHIKEALSDVNKVYGFDIKIEKVPNSSYVSEKRSYDHYPSNMDIYTTIDNIKEYIIKEKGKVMNDPILNITKENEHLYTVMVAVASDMDLPEKGNMMRKNMMLGNIVVAKVKGGPAAIEKCKRAVKYYVNDFRKISPAIAFERLITNRLKEDSAQWVTTINYPVFQ